MAQGCACWRVCGCGCGTGSSPTAASLSDGPRGGKGRYVPLPCRLVEPLKAQVERRRALYEADLSLGLDGVGLPGALSRKYPNAGRDISSPPRDFASFRAVGRGVAIIPTRVRYRRR